MSEGTSKQQALRTCLGLAFLLIGSHVLNQFIFPHFDALAPEARDISTYFGVFSLGVLAILAYRKPSVFHEKIWTCATITLIFIGSGLLYVGVLANTPAFLILGSPFGGVGAVWFSVLACVSLTKLKPKHWAICLPLAFALKYAAMFLLSFITLSLLASLILSFLCSLLSYLLVVPYAAEPIRTIQRVKPASELDVTNPSSFLPLSSPIFIAIFLFNVADGFALTFQQVNLSYTPMIIAFLPVLIILAGAIFKKKQLNADKLFLLSALLVFAGFLLAPFLLLSDQGAVGIQASNMCLRAGTDCFSLLMYLLIASVGARNELSTISMVALTLGASWLGIAAGALLGQLTASMAVANPAVVLLMAALVTFVFVGYSFVILRRFSFEETVQGILPVASVALKEKEEDSLSLEEQCETVIREYGLTNREGDVLKLLARGRTSSIIQEKLFLSHNTIKTHVRHIYTKMDIHSQQELIDKVESTR